MLLNKLIRGNLQFDANKNRFKFTHKHKKLKSISHHLKGAYIKQFIYIPATESVQDNCSFSPLRVISVA